MISQLTSTGWGPVTSWFINHEIIPMNTVVISARNHRIQPLKFEATERELERGPPSCMYDIWIDYDD